LDIIISTYLAAKTNKQIKKQINRKNRRKKQEFVFERGGMGGGWLELFHSGMQLILRPGAFRFFNGKMPS
jgi:hypothetical protein